MATLLALDIGNSNLVWKVYEETGDAPTPLASGRFETPHTNTLETLKAHLPSNLKGMEIAIASVVPALEPALIEFCHQKIENAPFFVRPERVTCIPIRYQNPATLGADRLCNAVAARARYGNPVIAIDYGTATKLEAVSAEGEYLGGAILPGIAISLQALFSRAARLAEVSWEVPPHAIGDTTARALQSGCFYGFLGQSEALIRRFREELGRSETPVVATGGLAGHIVPHCALIAHHDPELTLEGVRLIWQSERENHAKGR